MMPLTLFIHGIMSSQILDDIPHKHPSSIWSFADNTLTLVREAVLTAGYAPLTTLAEKAVVSYESPIRCCHTSWSSRLSSLTPSVLRNITIGRLRIVTDKCTYEFPARGTDIDGEEELQAELKVMNDAFWVRLCTMGDLGFAEAYMFGDVACEDLISTFLVGILSSSSSSSTFNTLNT